MRPLTLLGTVLFAGLTTMALAQQDTDRYRLEKSATGYVRMDTQTGEMSICEERAGQLVCKLAADERSAFQNELDELRAEVKTLGDRVVKLEGSLAARIEKTLPTEEEFERTMSYMERFFRSFMGIVRDIEKDRDPAGSDQKT